jgi:hypothetical protein
MTPEETLAAPPPKPPDWVEDSKILQEGRRYLRTFRLAVNHPWTFSSQWAQGTLEAMNPLTFFAITVGLRAGVSSLLRWGDAKGALAAADAAPALLRTPMGPYLLPVAMGLYLHFVALRRGRQRWQLTVGAVLFAQGSLASVVKLLYVAVVTPLTASSWPAAVATSGLLALLDGAIVAPFLAGAHQRSTWSMLGWCLSFYVAMLGVAAGLMLGFGSGEYG